MVDYRLEIRNILVKRVAGFRGIAVPTSPKADCNASSGRKRLHFRDEILCGSERAVRVNYRIESRGCIPIAFNIVKSNASVLSPSLPNGHSLLRGRESHRL